MNDWTALDRFLHTDPNDVGCEKAVELSHVYVDPVADDVLRPSDTVTLWPSEGQTTGYWNVSIGDTTQPDLAWAYDFSGRQLPVAGLVAFDKEKVHITLEGEPLPRPTAHFFK